MSSVFVDFLMTSVVDCMTCNYFLTIASLFNCGYWCTGSACILVFCYSFFTKSPIQGSRLPRTGVVKNICFRSGFVQKKMETVESSQS